MRNYDFLFILLCLFVVRVIAFSGTYADAICMLGLLAYAVSKEVLKQKKLSGELAEQIEQYKKTNDARLQELADEVVRIKNTSDGIKAAFNMTKR